MQTLSFNMIFAVLDVRFGFCHHVETVKIFFYILAQYAVLEMGDESMGEANFDLPPKPLSQFRCHVKHITTSPPLES